jgi:hypothetical protein
MQDSDPPTVAGLLDALSRFDLTPDDRATIELIRSDIATAQTATCIQGEVPEADLALARVFRELVDEMRTIARKYA